MKNYNCFLRIALSLFIFCFISLSLVTNAQNVAITDDNGYNADPSAMLDVKSTTKGMLVPRLTTAQRNAIVSPAAGLLVFDTNLGRYYYYGTSAWIDLSSGSASGSYWSYNAPYIYMTNLNDSLGLGTSTPLHKLHIKQTSGITDGTDGNLIDIQNSSTALGVLSGIRFWNGTTANTAKGAIFYRDTLSYGRGDLILANRRQLDQTDVSVSDGRLFVRSDGSVEVQGDPAAANNDALFSVRNSSGDTIFAVYQEGVRIFVPDDGLKAGSSRSGFAIGGYSISKGLTNEYLRVTPDSVRVYIKDGTGLKAGASKGGFAIGGFSISKGLTDDYMYVSDDSSRIWTDGEGGFEIADLATGSSKYMDITPTNYFIGHNSGINNVSAIQNSTMGYETAKNLSTGDYNNLFGYRSGYNLTTGSSNVFIGNTAGYSHQNGSFNVFVGNNSGYTNLSGAYNTFMGHRSGRYNVIGDLNVMLGSYSGENATGNENTFVGGEAGRYTTGDGNVTLGFRAGASNTGSRNVLIGYGAAATGTQSDRLYIENTNSLSYPLIYGEFDNNYLQFNGNARIFNNTDGASQKGLVIDCDGEYSDIPLRIRTNTNPANITDADTKFVIWGDGAMQINGGTAIDGLLAGTYAVGTNTGGVKTVTVNFGYTFATIPKINVTVHGENFTDVFAVTTRNITTTSFQVNIYRVDSPGGGWAQNLKIDWFAWSQ